MDAPRDRSFAQLTLREFLDLLSSSEPVPGGGSAAAVAASLGAALVSMVAALSEGRPRYAEHASLHRALRERGQILASGLIELADADAEAYGQFATALKLPRDDDAADAARTAALQHAARRAAEVPLETVEVCLDVVAAAEALAGRSNRNASSDLNVAAMLATAAARGAAANVLVNLPSLDAADPWAAQARSHVEELLREIQRLADMTSETVQSGASRDPLSAVMAGSST